MKLSKLNFVIIILATLSVFFSAPVFAQTQLDSTNYSLLDVEIGGVGGISESSNYALIQSSDPTANSRLESTNYALGSGFPSSFQANVPLIICIETSTDSGTTNCNNFPNANGAEGECGDPGCYDRAKIEIDHQDNPVDTVYLVRLEDEIGNFYYLQSDMSVSQTYDINDYLTLCEIEGVDTRTGSTCENGGDPNYNADLFSYNIFGLKPGETYEVSVRALSGDFTETQFSPEVQVTTEYPSLVFDLDIANSVGINTETSVPYSVNLGTITSSTATSVNRIWVDLGTNIVDGVNLYAKDSNSGLVSGPNLIPSQSEDLDVDSGGDGGYGLKLETISEDSLGPVLTTGSNYSTGSSNQVGNLTTSNSLVVSTSDSGSNLGQVSGGRVSLMVKAKSTTAKPAGIYSDLITFSLLANL